MLQWSQHGAGALSGGCDLHVAADLCLTPVSLLLLTHGAAQARIGLHYASADATRVWQQNAIRHAPEHAGGPVRKRFPPPLQAARHTFWWVLLPYASATEDLGVAAVLA